jgi:regulator of ribonuclease activity B
VAIFKKRERRGQAYATGHPLDDAQLAEIAARSDLTSPRHWIHYLYCRDEVAARIAAAEVTAGGWEIQGVHAAAQGPGWLVIAELHGAVTSPAAVRDARSFFESLAARVDGGDYDGWEASV